MMEELDLLKKDWKGKLENGIVKFTSHSLH